jgi:hypothetical protein
VFIHKFISQNQEFFKYDEAINKWLAQMENEVHFDSSDYEMEYTDIKALEA